MTQGSEQWFKDRTGKATASRFKDVKLDRNGNWTKTALSYAYEILAEKNLIERQEINSPALEHGTRFEDEARRLYEVRNCVLVEQVGFIESEIKGVGGSPDGLIPGGIIEIKCPHSPKRHQETLSTGIVPTEYIPQIQGNIWIADSEFCDYISFQPYFVEGKELKVIRVFRDDDYIADLKQVLASFVELLKELDK